MYCYEVLTRYFLGIATDWANDMFSNVLCVTIFSMVPHATRKGQHISISLVTEMVPRLQRPLHIFTGLFGVAVCILAAWMSLEENIRQIAFEIVTEQNRPIPKVWMSSFITFGFTGAGLYFFRSLIPFEAVQPKSWITPGSKQAASVG
jgi:TRAP-type C4-dicarboxylate transport system permease small subunit